MADYFFVLAFGQGRHGVDSESQQEADHSIRHMQEAATRLRTVIETACKTEPRQFSENVQVSVAPGGVMLAFPDNKPDRAIQLCEAVVCTLDEALREHPVQAPLPMCAVITHGMLREVPMPGFARNFEGWPAIAAARVLGKLSPGELAIEESVWEFKRLLRACDSEKTLPGKHDGEAFQVRIHQQIQFPTTSHAQAAQQASPQVQLPPYTESAQKARERIAALLQDPRVYALGEAIVRQDQEHKRQSAEDILVPDHATSLLSVLKLLQDATLDCLQRLAVSQSQNIGPTKTVANDILSCLTALAIDRDGLSSAGQAFDPWQSHLRLTLPLVSEAGVEVMVSSLGDHPARFRELKNNKNPRVVGKDSITRDELETGLTHKDRLMGLLQRTWCAVMQVERAPDPLREGDIKRLRSVLSIRDEDKTHLYYITLPPVDPSSQVDAVLLDSLLHTLPSLRVFSFSGADSTGLLCVDEYQLWARIEQFLHMVKA